MKNRKSSLSTISIIVLIFIPFIASTCTASSSKITGTCKLVGYIIKSDDFREWTSDDGIYHSRDWQIINNCDMSDDRLDGQLDARVSLERDSKKEMSVSSPGYSSGRFTMKGVDGSVIWEGVIAGILIGSTEEDSWILVGQGKNKGLKAVMRTVKGIENGGSNSDETPMEAEILEIKTTTTK